MSGGEVLIVAVLILGAVIATLGDRIGTRVGKARLSLFKLRPRKTATLVTIITGILISASTLGILLAANNQLRTGLFRLGTIQRLLRTTSTELEQARTQKGQVERELTKSRADRKAAKQQLVETNQSLKGAIAERSRAQAETARIQTALSSTQSRLMLVSQQALRLRSEISQLQAQRDRVIGQREQEVRARDQIIQQREVRLKDLEQQQETLIQQQETLIKDVQRLRVTAEGLRTGNVAIQRGQVLASVAIRTTNLAVAKQAVDQLLREANQTALRSVRPGGASEQIVQITNAEVKQLLEQIDDGQDYIVRIYSGANYLVGEKLIQVFADAVRNRVVFLTGDVVAGTSLNPSTTPDDELQQRINLLLAAANFRARNLGILSDSVQIGRIQDVITFIEQLKQYKQTIELRAVAADVIYTAGPLNLELVATQNGRVLLRTKNLTPTTGGQTP